MAGFLLRRTGTALVVLLVTSVLVFVGVRAIPGTPVSVLAAEQQDRGEGQLDPKLVAYVTHKYELDRPLPVQYVHWLWLVLHGDLGQTHGQQSVGRLIFWRLPVTLELAVLSILLAALVGTPLGVIAAVRRGRTTDHVSTGIAVVGISAQPVWIAFLLITWFAVDLHWLPAGGYRPISHPAANLEHMVLPVIVLAIGIAAPLVRQTRTSMLNALGSDYVRTARAKGLTERSVVARHALRNSLITVVTLLGLTFGSLLTTTAIAETIFGIPGFGQLTATAVGRRDYPLVEGVVLVAAVGYVVASLLVDVAYSLLNPRIRVS
jgi:peptide/nickel transport system permease protein